VTSVNQEIANATDGTAHSNNGMILSSATHNHQRLSWPIVPTQSDEEGQRGDQGAASTAY